MSAPRIAVIIVEDDARYRGSVAELLRLTADFEVAAEFASASECLAALEDPARAREAEHWRLALMDLDMPGVGGIEATRRLKRRLHGLRVVVITVFEDPATILQAISAGADGYLLKSTDPAALLELLRGIASGGAPLTPGVARIILEAVRRLAPEAPASDLGLTARERDVLRALVDGLPYKLVADRLGISLDTVRTHVRAVYRKLQVHNVAEAVSRAIREGLLGRT